MNYLKGTSVYLRALEPSDLDYLYRLENDSSVWEVSNTLTPYSKFVLKNYLENAHRDIYDVKQLRLTICLSNNDRPLGFVDLFDFEPKHKRVGVGIIILEPQDRSKGYAKESLQLIMSYAFDVLGVHQIFANITEDNQPSIGLFTNLGFNVSGVKQEWIVSGGGYKNELFVQKIRS